MLNVPIYRYIFIPIKGYALLLTKSKCSSQFFNNNVKWSSLTTCLYRQYHQSGSIWCGYYCTSAIFPLTDVSENLPLSVVVVVLLAATWLWWWRDNDNDDKMMMIVLTTTINHPWEGYHSSLFQHYVLPYCSDIRVLRSIFFYYLHIPKIETAIIPLTHDNTDIPATNNKIMRLQYSELCLCSFCVRRSTLFGDVVFAFLLEACRRRRPSHHHPVGFW